MSETRAAFLSLVAGTLLGFGVGLGFEALGFFTRYTSIPTVLGFCFALLGLLASRANSLLGIRLASAMLQIFAAGIVGAGIGMYLAPVLAPITAVWGGIILYIRWKSRVEAELYAGSPTDPAG